VERRLRANSQRLTSLREELGITDEQLGHFGDEAEDARIRAMVSETSMAQREQVDAERHAAALARRRAEVQAEIERLEQDQDALLDELGAS
jgi:predicted  nucleic acid-binding Zn-ribbon protein